MLSSLAAERQASLSYFNRTSGVVNSGQGMTGDETLTAIIMLIMLGTFLGLVSGLLVSNLLRFVSMYTGKDFGSAGWTIASTTFLGAVISAILVFTADRD